MICGWKGGCEDKDEDVAGGCRSRASFVALFQQTSVSKNVVESLGTRHARRLEERVDVVDQDAELVRLGLGPLLAFLLRCATKINVP